MPFLLIGNFGMVQSGWGCRRFIFFKHLLRAVAIPSLASFKKTIFLEKIIERNLDLSSLQRVIVFPFF